MNDARVIDLCDSDASPPPPLPQSSTSLSSSSPPSPSSLPLSSPSSLPLSSPSSPIFRPLGLTSDRVEGIRAFEARRRRRGDREKRRAVTEGGCARSRDGHWGWRRPAAALPKTTSCGKDDNENDDDDDDDLNGDDDSDGSSLPPVVFSVSRSPEEGKTRPATKSPPKFESFNGGDGPLRRGAGSTDGRDDSSAEEHDDTANHGHSSPSLDFETFDATLVRRQMTDTDTAMHEERPPGSRTPPPTISHADVRFCQSNESSIADSGNASFSSNIRKTKSDDALICATTARGAASRNKRPRQHEDVFNIPQVSSSSVVLLLTSDDDDEDEDDDDDETPTAQRRQVQHSSASSEVHTEKYIKFSDRSFDTSLPDETSFDMTSPFFQPELRRHLTTPQRRGSPLPLDEIADFDTPVFQPNLARRTESDQSVSEGNYPFTRTVKQRVPTPALPELMNELGGTLYPDLRHEFINALATHAKVVRCASHQRAIFDSTIRAITILSLRPYPIRSAEAVRSIKGIGRELLDVLKEAADRCKKKRRPYTPEKDKFGAVAPAALVALLRHEQEDPNERRLCTMEDLILRTNSLLDTTTKLTMDQEVSYYLNRDTLDPGWSQVKKLCTENSHAGMVPLVKERKNKSMCNSGIVFELLDEGRTMAQRLQEAAAVIENPLGPLRQLASDLVDYEYKDVTMSMDFREGGGGSKSLHKMCNLLDQHGVPFVVKELKISDYVFFVGNKLAPILIERKTADDVANSLADGRWERQQRSMRKAQYVLGGGEARRCQICYIIEGDPKKRTVHGGNVGRVSWDQSLEAVENAIEDLPRLGFSVMKTKSSMGSMVLLAKVAKDVSWKANNGSIDATLTYDEFIRKVNCLEDGKGDPPTLREHQYPAAPVVDETSRMLETNSRDHIGGERSAGFLVAEEPNDKWKEKEAEFKKLSIAQLKTKCKDRDEKMSGTKAELIARLLKPRKPEVLITRARKGEYVPKFDSCNAALLLALLLNDSTGNGLTKEELMLFAQATGVSKEPMDSKNGYYDGWSGMGTMLKGDPALVVLKKKKYRLTQVPCGGAGHDVAAALHKVAHREGTCACGDTSIL